MPLDVQPLSSTRRAVMLLVLILLFGGSLGFAQYLIGKRPAAIVVVWNLPKELLRAPAVADDVEGVQFRCVGTLNHKRREVVGYIGDVPAKLTPEEQLLHARLIFSALNDFDADLERSGILAARSAVELEGQDDRGTFALLRVVIDKDKAVAICYSGGGPITDGDRLYLNQLCHHVEIRDDGSHPGK